MKVFKTHKDPVIKWVFLFPVIGFIIVSAVISILVLLGIMNIDGLLLATMFMVFGILGIQVWRGLRYVIENNRTLKIKIFNFTVHEIRISEIISIEKRRKSSYGYSLSMDYISLKTLGGEINISPENRKEFIQEILRINPHTVNKVQV